jgi:hypothetical protein
VICQCIARQRLDKHPAIRARNNRANVYSSLLGNSQRANGLADCYHVTCFLRGLRYATKNCFLCCPCRGYNTSPLAAMESESMHPRVEAGSNTSTVTLRVVGKSQMSRQ